MQASASQGLHPVGARACMFLALQLQADTALQRAEEILANLAAGQPVRQERVSSALQVCACQHVSAACRAACTAAALTSQ
jgi:hypothetical protein